MALDFGQYASFASGALGAGGGSPAGGGGSGYGASESGSTGQQITPTITIGGLRTSGGQSVSTKASQATGNSTPENYGGENGYSTSVPGSQLGVGFWIGMGAIGLLAFGALMLAVVKR